MVLVIVVVATLWDKECVGGIAAAIVRHFAEVSLWHMSESSGEEEVKWK
jgi:hypothetical protein